MKTKNVVYKVTRHCPSFRKEPYWFSKCTVLYCSRGTNVIYENRLSTVYDWLFFKIYFFVIFIVFWNGHGRTSEAVVQMFGMVSREFWTGQHSLRVHRLVYQFHHPPVHLHTILVQNWSSSLDWHFRDIDFEHRFTYLYVYVRHGYIRQMKKKEIFRIHSDKLSSNRDNKRLIWSRL